MTDASLDTSTPHPARRYNYWLGGKDNFAADRDSGDRVAKVFPSIVEAARENRRFLQRAVRFLAGECGIDQFLDIGAGLPSVDNTHEVAQRINPAARIVYVDNDPMVLAHGRALLFSAPQGRTAMVPADLRQPAAILANPALRETLDLGRPVGLLLVAVLHFLDDADEPHRIVGELLGALPAGSWLVVSHVSQDLLTAEIAALSDQVISESEVPTFLRTGEQISGFFSGLDLAEPGLVPVHRWRPDAPADALAADTDIGVYGGVAVKPA
ncbi:SAM-dependent methyltransferase [Paractinoplanes hotanensis]|uniref:SAM-dependent methyltransferase n=1 Tax=Paractinoplanes hotanensis TaxID=2906497 RepID=A0ABT0Y848_9ACTN|nr:SAM-dependent methyltransferase [Actinoplanes hotanensis]MCM4082222.1 SAM-dependent methyltransferase [Actinoplanes hotanensis]